MSLTWLLIALLGVSLSGTLGGWLFSDYRAGCHQENAYLLATGKQGPLRECP